MRIDISPWVEVEHAIWTTMDTCCEPEQTVWELTRLNDGLSLRDVEML